MGNAAGHICQNAQEETQKARPHTQQQLSAPIIRSSSERVGGREGGGAAEVGGGDSTGRDGAPLGRQPLRRLKEVVDASGGEAASE